MQAQGGKRTEFIQGGYMGRQRLCDRDDRWDFDAPSYAPTTEFVYTPPILVFTPFRHLPLPLIAFVSRPHASRVYALKMRLIGRLWKVESRSADFRASDAVREAVDRRSPLDPQATSKQETEGCVDKSYEMHRCR